MYMYLLDSKYIFKFIAEKLISVKKDCKKRSPTPGIEPGPSGWKPGITPPWRSYQTRFWEPSGDILAEALVGLNKAWQLVGMVIHGEVPYHKSAVCLQNTFLAVAS